LTKDIWKTQKWIIIEEEIKDQATFDTVLNALQMKSRAGAFDEIPDLLQ
jgi:hypothetical protein